MHTKIIVETHCPNIVDITERVRTVVHESKVVNGLCTLFIQHTSASILIQENEEGSVKYDLQKWLDKLVPQSNEFTHDTEGPDDMPSHIKAALLPTSICIPIEFNQLVLGKYQGIFLWEHRESGRDRSIYVSIIED